MVILHTRFVALLLVVPFVASCASETLRGVPQGLGKDAARTKVLSALVDESAAAIGAADPRHHMMFQRLPTKRRANLDCYLKANGAVFTS